MTTTRLSVIAMEATLGADITRSRRRTPSDRLLSAFAYSPPEDLSYGMDSSGDLDEHEVFWSGPNPSPPQMRRAAPGEGGRGGRWQPEEKQGILAALFEDDGGMEKRSAWRPRSRFLNRNAFVTNPSRMVPSIPMPHELFSQSLPVGKLHQSAPRNLPMAVKALPPKKGGNREKVGDFQGSDDEEGSDEEEEMLPPHEIVAKRTSKESPFSSSFSVLEGRGRTLKGRDLRRVRNAVLTRTGFLD